MKNLKNTQQRLIQVFVKLKSSLVLYTEWLERGKAWTGHWYSGSTKASINIISIPSKKVLTILSSSLCKFSSNIDWKKINVRLKPNRTFIWKNLTFKWPKSGVWLIVLICSYLLFSSFHQFFPLFDKLNDNLCHFLFSHSFQFFCASILIGCFQVFQWIWNKIFLLLIVFFPLLNYCQRGIDCEINQFELPEVSWSCLSRSSFSNLICIFLRNLSSKI